MTRRFLAPLLLGALTADVAAIECDSKIPFVCNMIKDKAEKVFGETLGGNFSLLIGHKDFGRLVSAGANMASDEEVVVASASKMLSAAAILWQVDRAENVSISTPVRDYLPWWKTTDPLDPRSAVTLEHMLSQTDGFGQSPTANFTEGAEAIFEKDYASLATPATIFTVLPTENYTGKMSIGENHSSPYTWGKTPMADLPKPGGVFYYEETHWRMAAAAVEQISGQNLDEVTAALAKEFGMKKSHLENIPQLGGPEWISTAEDLEVFLGRLLKRDFLKPETQAAFEQSHTNDAEWFGFRARPDWGYAMGSWAHCPKGGCAQFSSIGLFGTLPFVDFKAGIYFALMRPAGMDPTKGVLMDRSVAFWEEVYHPFMEQFSQMTLSEQEVQIV